MPSKSPNSLISHNNRKHTTVRPKTNLVPCNINTNVVTDTIIPFQYCSRSRYIQAKKTFNHGCFKWLLTNIIIPKLHPNESIQDITTNMMTNKIITNIPMSDFKLLQ